MTTIDKIEMCAGRCCGDDVICHCGGLICHVGFGPMCDTCGCSGDDSDCSYEEDAEDGDDSHDPVELGEVQS